MAKKKLVVPQEGTQPAQRVEIAPIDNLFSDLANSRRSKAIPRKPTSFNLNTELFKMFKSECARLQISMSSVIEDAMMNFIKTHNGNI